MKKLFFLLLFSSIIFIACKSEKKPEEITENKIEKKQESIDVSDVSVRSLNYNELKPLLEKNNDSIYVVNFWATWCKPCIEELPAFEKLNQEYNSENVNVLLVSLDFPNQIESRLKPYIIKKNLQSKVVLLDDVNEDVWIKAISEKWSGAIPATIIYNKNSKKFYEQSFNYETLETELKTFLN